MLKHFLVRGTLLLEAAAGKFVWSENLAKVITAALLSMVPTFEGRYALTVAQAMGMPVLPAFLIALIFSTLPMLLLLPLLRPVLDFMYRLPIGFVRKIAAWVDRRAERKAGAMDKNGLFGLYLFVAVPLPGTGVWTGSAIATLFEMPRLKSAAAILLGNATACALMTAASLGAISLF